MRYVLGVEGGQTSTTAVVIDETGMVLGIGQSGNPIPTSTVGIEGAERARRSVLEAIQSAVVMADLQNARIAAAFLSLHPNTDAGRNSLAAVVPAEQLFFGDSARSAFYAVTFGRPGAVVIAGTRAAAYGVNRDGKQAQSGGWGMPGGDEGSSQWIALHGVAVCCRSADGIDAPTAMLPLLLKYFAAADLRRVRDRLSQPETYSDLTALAEIVHLAAAKGDAAAKRILREAGKELAFSLLAVLKSLGLQNESVTVGAVGEVFLAGRAVLRSFREQVRKSAPNATIAATHLPFAIGAGLIGLEEIGVELDDPLCRNVGLGLTRLSAARA